jgi:hypothetical protein
MVRMRTMNCQLCRLGPCTGMHAVDVLHLMRKPDVKNEHTLPHDKDGWKNIRQYLSQLRMDVCQSMVTRQALGVSVITDEELDAAWAWHERRNGEDLADD